MGDWNAGWREQWQKKTMSEFVSFQHVNKIYKTGEVEIPALRDVNFEIGEGEFCVIVGASGAGKTTILNILGGMDTLTSGQVFLDGKEISGYDKRELTSYRRYDIGFVFQFYNLVQNLTALENVELASQICREPLDAATVLKEVGLSERLSNFPAQLSGGEQQRVAIARALAKNPKLLLCDEPTGALDYNTGKAVLKLLQDTCREKGKTVVVITHNQAITAMADRIITVKNGTVVRMEKNEHIVDIAEIEW
jgi:putative ABC transport system ATP-binding protein